MMLRREIQRETVRLRPLLTTKKLLKMGTWNVRTLYEAGRTMRVVREMKNYGISILGLSELRWLQSGQKKLFSGKVILYSGPKEDNAPTPPYRRRSLCFSREAQQALIGWELVNSWIISATFNTRNKNIKLNVVQCHAPTNDTVNGKDEAFYEQLQNFLHKLKLKDITILIGDFNAKIGANNTGYEDIMGK